MIYKDLQLQFEKRKRGMEKNPDENRRKLALTGFDEAERIVDEVFGHRRVQWRKYGSLFESSTRNEAREEIKRAIRAGLVYPEKPTFYSTSNGDEKNEER